MNNSLLIKLISIIGISFFISCGSEGGKSGKNNIGIQIGEELPNIKLKSPKHSELSLNDLRGSLVLVDFWASWCVPCRTENVNLVALHEKFKSAEFKVGKGFKIFSVSLDGSGDPKRESHHKALWEKAISFDKLNWPYQVSDLKGWTSPLIDTFDIESIPKSYLIDGEGKILAKDLRGLELEKKIISLLQKK